MSIDLVGSHAPHQLVHGLHDRRPVLAQPTESHPLRLEDLWTGPQLRQCSAEFAVPVALHRPSPHQ